MIRIVRAESERDLKDALRLFKEYARALPFGLEFQDFEDELRSFPGAYGPPRGCVLLARAHGRAAGCVAMRPLQPDGVCELKRLYVVPGFRRTGMGRQLSAAIIEEARQRGYATMRLDTVESMTGANTLYETMGFRRIDSYRFNPLPDAVFMELDLGD